MFRILLFILFLSFSGNLFSQDYYWCSKCNAYHIKEKTLVVSTPSGIQQNLRNLPVTWPTWTWPGILQDHLLQTHKINTAGWSQSERINLHNYMHNTARRPIKR